MSAHARRPTEPSTHLRRLRDDRGSGMVAGLTFMFALTFLGLVWLASDVSRGASNQSAAQSIAFQAARSGAQAALVDDVRGGQFTRLDERAAREAAGRTASQLFASYDVAGEVNDVDVDEATGRVTVTVSIEDGSIVVTGTGTVRAERVT